MDREYSATLPDRLIQHLRDNAAGCSFRRRAVLTNASGRWELVCCVVEGFPREGAVPAPTPTQRYRQAILYEDTLSGDECLRFARELHEGQARFADLVLPRVPHAQWVIERLPIPNEYMSRAGYAIGLAFAAHSGRGTVRTLLAVNQPYYADSDEAARNWLPFPVYHGSSDARNDSVLFLLPETRAFIAEAKLSDGDVMTVSVAGREAETLPLLVKGACWEGKILHQLEAAVSGAKATLLLPRGTDRLEYFLLGGDGTVYDYQREDAFYFETKRRGVVTVERAGASLVRGACRAGEGLEVEFKPFIELPKPKERTAGRTKHPGKMRELAETVAAFANSKGGRIYLGVDDDCTISGIGEALCAWAGEGLSDTLVERYLGALKGRIKELLHGEVALNLFCAAVDGALVGVVEVAEGVHGPVALQQEYHLYIRSGASNRKASPDQWSSILSSRRNVGGVW